MLGGASFHRKTTLVLDVPCEIEEDHVAALDVKWRVARKHLNRRWAVPISPAATLPYVG